MLETVRLWLVPVTLELVEARLRAASFVIDVGVGAAISVEPPWPGDAIAFFDSFAVRMREGPPVEFSLSMVEKSSLQMVGMLGCVDVPTENVVEIGYGVNPQREGRGLATEAVAALVGRLHDEGLHTVTATTSTSNVGSRRVLEKNGFRHNLPHSDSGFVRWKHIDGIPVGSVGS